MKIFSILAIVACAATLFAFGGETNSIPEPKFYHIRNCKYDRLLRPENASNADGTRIVLYSAQPWKCMTWKLQPAGNSAFELQNYFTSKTFAAKTNDAVVQVPWSRDEAARPTWNFLKLSDGFYQITDVKTGRTLTGSRNGVTLEPWTEKSEQKWELIETDPSKLTM